MINVERIFNLDNAQSMELEHRLQTQYGPLEPVHEVNEIFSPRAAMGEMPSQLGNPPLIQIRTVNNEATFMYSRELDSVVVSRELGISSAAVMADILKDLDYISLVTVNRAYLEATMGEMTIRHYTDWDWQGDPTRFCWLRLAVEDKAAIPDADAQIIAQAHQFGYIGEHQSSPMMNRMVVDLPEEI